MDIFTPPDQLAADPPCVPGIPISGFGFRVSGSGVWGVGLRWTVLPPPTRIVQLAARTPFVPGMRIAYFGFGSLGCRVGWWGWSYLRLIDFCITQL